MHLGTHAIISLPTSVRVPALERLFMAYFFDTGPVIFLESAFYTIGSPFNVAQLLTIYVFRFCSHARNGEDLLVLLYALLELAEQYAETCRIVSRQTGSMMRVTYLQHSHYHPKMKLQMRPWSTRLSESNPRIYSGKTGKEEGRAIARTKTKADSMPKSIEEQNKRL